MVRFRISTDPGDGEVTWVLLPDEAAARTQAEELALREKSSVVRLYRETVDLSADGVSRELLCEYRGKEARPSPLPNCA